MSLVLILGLRLIFGWYETGIETGIKLVQPQSEVVFLECTFMECIGFTMEAFNVGRNEKHKNNYNIHRRIYKYKTCIFFMYVL
jgi:hypothetical protein